MEGLFWCYRKGKVVSIQHCITQCVTYTPLSCIRMEDTEHLSITSVLLFSPIASVLSAGRQALPEAVEIISFSDQILSCVRSFSPTAVSCSLNVALQQMVHNAVALMSPFLCLHSWRHVYLWEKRWPHPLHLASE